MKARTATFELKIIAYGLLWWLRGLKGGTREATLYPRKNLYWVEPNRIWSSIDHPRAEGLRPQDGWSVTPALESDLVIAGDWDLNTIPFEEMDVWKAFKHVFADGGGWDDTAFFTRNLEEIRSARYVWSCHNEEEFRRRLQSVEALYSQIKGNGFRTQTDLQQSGHAQARAMDEISVHIGRDGDYIFADGRHRLCIAKLLNLEKVPVRVCRRHRAWVNFKNEICEYARRNKGRLYAPILHPDLADIPHHQDDDRIQMLRPEFAGKSGTVLDIGAHWGYFCHWFERWGYSCTAIECSPVNLHFMKKIQRAEHRQFAIHAGSALDYNFSRTFDIVLALNIFHHFIKSESGFEALQSLLGRMPVKTMVFEPHLPTEEQMAGSYRNFEPREFVGWVKEHGKFRSVRTIGVARDGRTLFLLER